MQIPKKGWRATVIVPARNEEASLSESLPNIRQWRDAHSNRDNIRLLLVNDGSSDSTKREAERMGFEVIPSHSEGHSVGKTLAVKRGVEHAANEHKPHAVVFLDADLIRPSGSSIDKLLEPVLKGEHDMVVGVQGEGIYDLSMEHSGQRAISMKALNPWLKGHKDWRFEESWALEPMLNGNISRQWIRQPHGRGETVDFYTKKAFRQSTEAEQIAHRRKVYDALRAKKNRKHRK
jgi:glycosyltransferase involved in cell wall biosynthesis